MNKILETGDLPLPYDSWERLQRSPANWVQEEAGWYWKWMDEILECTWNAPGTFKGESHLTSSKRLNAQGFSTYLYRMQFSNKKVITHTSVRSVNPPLNVLPVSLRLSVLFIIWSWSQWRPSIRSHDESLGHLIFVDFWVNHLFELACCWLNTSYEVWSL